MRYCIRFVLFKIKIKRHNYIISFPALDQDGDIEFCGQHFSMKETEIKVSVDMEMEDMDCQLY